jgi:hypothetical protein
MSDMLNNNGFWTLAGIILGGLITHVFWYLQTKRQEKIKVRTDRQNKIFNYYSKKLCVE